MDNEWTFDREPVRLDPFGNLYVYDPECEWAGFPEPEPEDKR